MEADAPVQPKTFLPPTPEMPSSIAEAAPDTQNSASDRDHLHPPGACKKRSIVGPGEPKPAGLLGLLGAAAGEAGVSNLLLTFLVTAFLRGQNAPVDLLASLAHDWLLWSDIKRCFHRVCSSGLALSDLVSVENSASWQG